MTHSLPISENPAEQRDGGFAIALGSLIVVCQVFPVRIGPLDSGVATALVGLLMFWPTRFSARLLGPIVVALLLLVYTIVVVLSQQAAELFVVVRHARLAFSVIVLALLVSVIPGGERRIVRTIAFGLRLHAAAIYLQIVMPGVRGPIAGLVGIGAERAFFPWRAFGLAGSYDAASFFIAVGMVLALAGMLQERRPRYLVESLLLWGAGVLTGRTFWLVGTILLAVIILVTAFRGRGFSRFVVIGGALAVGIWLAIAVGPLLLLSLFPERYGFSVELERALRSAGYYAGTAEVLRSSIRYPSGASFLLGAGSNAAWTDFGYLKIIFMNGIVGLGLLFGFHLWLAGGALARWYRLPTRPASDLLLAGVFVLLLAYNVKFLVFGSRAAFELFLLLAFARWTYAPPVRLA